jgi:hypothetical protein
MPTLDRITIYPVKSLDGLDVAEARVLPAGGLEHDRRWQLTDLEGRVLNAKRSPLFHAIRAEFDLGGAGGLPASAGHAIHLAIDPAAAAARAIPGIERLASLEPASFPLVPGPEGPCGWLSEVFGTSVLLLERADGGFPGHLIPAPVTVRWRRPDVMSYSSRGQSFVHRGIFHASNVRLGSRSPARGGVRRRGERGRARRHELSARRPRTDAPDRRGRCSEA